jgi:hypothetical protein
VNADAECAESPAGMGIQFKALSEENQQLIDAYIESRL